MTNTKTWQRRVTAWRASGLTAAQFGAREGINPASLYHWSWRLGREEEDEDAELDAETLGAEEVKEPRIVRLVREAPDAGSAIEIVVGDVTVAVRSGFDASMLRDVLGVLATRADGGQR